MAREVESPQYLASVAVPKRREVFSSVGYRRDKHRNCTFFLFLSPVSAARQFPANDSDTCGMFLSWNPYHTDLPRC
jgi:hypothetical protein